MTKPETTDRNLANAPVPENEAARLLPALRWLDRLLARAVAAAQAVYGPEAADPFRGLHLGAREVERLLMQEPGSPTLDLPPEEAEDDFSDAVSQAPRLLWLQQTFGLSNGDLRLLVLALSPELDLRYERLYAYLQNDVTRRRPSADLALNLLCASAEEKFAARARLAPDAPLLAHRLLHVLPDPDRPDAPLLSRALKADEQTVRLLLGTEEMDSRLVPFCRWIAPAVSLDELPLEQG